MKKNYIDPTAGFFYILGCSIVHFSLFIAQFFIHRPNIEQAKAYDAEYLKNVIKEYDERGDAVGKLFYVENMNKHACEEAANYVSFCLTLIHFSHALCCLICG